MVPKRLYNLLAQILVAPAKAPKQNQVHHLLPAVAAEDLDSKQSDQVLSLCRQFVVIVKDWEPSLETHACKR